MTTFRHLSISIAAVTVVSNPLPVAAETPAEESETLIRQGNDLRKHHEDARALPYFQKAYRISRNPRAAAQLGLAEIVLGYWLDAEKHLAEALADPDHEWVQTHRAVLEEQLANARKKLGAIEIVGEPSGAEVLINSTPVGHLPIEGPLRVTKGPVGVEVRAPGYAKFSRTVTVAAGSTERVYVALAVVAVTETSSDRRVATPAAPADPTAAPALPPASVRRRNLLRPLAWTAALVAGATLVVGVVETVVAVRRQNEFWDKVDTAGKPCNLKELSSDCRPIAKAYDHAKLGAVVGYASSVVLGATAAVLFVLSSSHDAQNARASREGFQCTPNLDSKGVLCAIRF